MSISATEAETEEVSNQPAGGRGVAPSGQEDPNAAKSKRATKSHNCERSRGRWTDVWGGNVSDVETTASPPDRGKDKESIELAQAEPKMIETHGETQSLYIKRSATRQSAIFQSAKMERSASGHGPDCIPIRHDCESATHRFALNSIYVFPVGNKSVKCDREYYLVCLRFIGVVRQGMPLWAVFGWRLAVSGAMRYFE